MPIAQAWPAIFAGVLISTLSNADFPRALAGQLAVADAHLSALKPADPPKGFAQLCADHPWACMSDQVVRQQQSEGTRHAIARNINSAVNRSIRPVSDTTQYGMEEFWTVPLSGKGDCEDYSIMKKLQLIKSGVQGSDLLLAQVFTSSLEPHVVLVLRSESGDYVLDNLETSIRHWKQTGYTFVKMQRPEDKAAWDVILLGPHARR